MAPRCWIIQKGFPRNLLFSWNSVSKDEISLPSREFNRGSEVLRILTNYYKLLGILGMNTIS